MKICLIGKQSFGAEVCRQLLNLGHDIVLVCTELDKNGRADLLALEAEKHKKPVLKTKSWRRKNKETGKFELEAEVFNEYRKYGPEVNVVAFCTQFIPQEVMDFPTHKTIIYHPSILPKHRGASAINWTLIDGDEEAGLTRKCAVEDGDTLNILYKRFLFPEGVKAMVESVNLIAAGKAPKIPQPEEGASYEPFITAKPELAQILWSKIGTQRQLHNFIRGNDSVPGAWTRLNGEKFILLGASLWKRLDPPQTAREIAVEEAPGGKLWAHPQGLLFKTADGKFVNVETMRMEDGRTIKAANFGMTEDIAETKLELTAEERKLVPALKSVWKGILNMSKSEEIDDEMNFFDAGATSADMTRLVEEVRAVCGVELQNNEIFMNPQFGDFLIAVVRKYRGEDLERELHFEKFESECNGMKITVPIQMYINGKFCESKSGRRMETIDPSNERPICTVPKGNASDVDFAVRCAEEAFYHGEWSRISARERGQLLYRLANLMDQHRAELATIESIDSGAVYTLALKTHIGMSIDVWRYFAGWCDKIQGKTIPISESRPNFNLCATIREPIGVVGLITPWNYPLMMLSWKMAACLAAGNTVVHKPAQVSPLTALKFAELSHRAGFPSGVINIVTGTGSEIGQAISDHPRIRKLGFTGSTEIGSHIMSCCAKSNVKKVSLELGGKSPLIIFSDVDVDKVVRKALDAVFFNKGENCIAAGRLFVEERIHDDFVRKVVEKTSQIVIGHPLDRTTQHGPQNHLSHLQSLLRYVEKAVAEGAKLAYGGKRCAREGIFLEPTVLTEVEDDNHAAKEESFGPVMVISKFNERDIELVIERANRTEFGLAGGVFSKDISRALRVARQLRCGTVFLNTYQKTDVAAPFGGFKQSGFGKDLGEEALNEYLQTKTITMEY
uniref:10-formyltetrahydrofolate dehydrogenase n=1 Tax=Globodera rostochiensis TaxID=31243 RepID=A0A914HVA2_GLORO